MKRPGIYLVTNSREPKVDERSMVAISATPVGKDRCGYDKQAPDDCSRQYDDIYEAFCWHEIAGVRLVELTICSVKPLKRLAFQSFSN